MTIHLEALEVVEHVPVDDWMLVDELTSGETEVSLSTNHSLQLLPKHQRTEVGHRDRLQRYTVRSASSKQSHNVIELGLNNINLILCHGLTPHPHPFHDYYKHFVQSCWYDAINVPIVGEA